MRLALALQRLAKLLIKLVYDVKVDGAYTALNNPYGTILVANHISFIDFLLIPLVMPKNQVIFSTLDYSIYHTPSLKWFLDRVGTILPMATRKQNLAARENTFMVIQHILSRGGIVLLFPEGVVTYDGKMQPFQRGYQRLTDENPKAVVIPIVINGLQHGSFFSRVGGLFNKSKLSKEWRRKVTIEAGEPMEVAKVENWMGQKYGNTKQE